MPASQERRLQRENVGAQGEVCRTRWSKKVVDTCQSPLGNDGGFLGSLEKDCPLPNLSLDCP